MNIKMKMQLSNLALVAAILGVTVIAVPVENPVSSPQFQP